MMHFKREVSGVARKS